MSTTPPRNLIVFQPSTANAELLQELSDHDWNLYIASDIDQAIELTRKLTFYVGFCLIEVFNDAAFLVKVQTLLRCSGGINWIMGLPKECKVDGFDVSREAKLITEFCYDYVTLPVSTERLMFALGRAYGMSELAAVPLRQLQEQQNKYGIVGLSPTMLKLFSMLDKVAAEDYSVLIEGETGTGKEMIANAIHSHSRRAQKPLVEINCGAFPRDLIQAELFGYEKGAFTGAIQRNIGRIESAQGGTLFLDEIGDLPMEQQVNMLRFLEERIIQRIGGREKIPIDVRIIAATHVDLAAAVQEGRFRQDLYYRLRVLPIKVPPLRERGEDVELLAWHFFKKIAENQKYKAKGFSPDALYILRNYDWPGNVRELMNCVRHAIVMSENRLLTPADLGLERRYRERTHKTLEEARAYADRESIITTLHHCNFNMSRAAEVLGISRVSLYRLIDKYQLKV